MAEMTEAQKAAALEAKKAEETAAAQVVADQAAAQAAAKGADAPAERKFVEDKVYLRSPSGVIFEYEALVANQPGFISVIPNKSKDTIAREKAAMGVKPKQDETPK